MTLEDRIERLESRLNNLQNAFLQSQINQVPITAKTDDTASKVVEITPWTASKTAYIDDTEVTFTDAPQGNVSVYMTDKDGQNVPCTFERVYNGIKVSFEKRNSLAEVNISII